MHATGEPFAGVSRCRWARVLAPIGGVLVIVGLMAQGCSEPPVPKEETAATPATSPATSPSATPATSGTAAAPPVRLGPADEAQGRLATEFSTAVLEGRIEAAMAMANEAFLKSPGEKGLKVLAAVLSDYGKGQFVVQSAAPIGDGLTDVVGRIRFADGTERTAHVLLRGDKVEAFTITQ